MRALERPAYLAAKEMGREVPCWVVFITYPSDPMEEYNVYFSSKGAANAWMKSAKPRPIKRMDGPYEAKALRKYIS